jgi:hypothetical protein
MSDPLLFVDTSESNVTVTGNLHVTNHVGVGTALPGGTLDVAAQHGDITNPMVHFRANRDGASNGDGNVLKLENSGNRSDAELLQCVSSGNDRFVVKANGNVDISGNLDVGGRITSENPAFHAWRNAGDITTTDTAIVWNQVRFNRGSCYNTGDGFFTAPVTGMYFFSVFGMTDSHAAAVCSFRFKIAPPGGSEGGFINAFWPYQYSHASTGQHVSCAASFVYYLDAGAKFRVYYHGTELLARGNAHNGFSGFLIG